MCENAPVAPVRRQVAVIPVRRGDNGLEVCLTRRKDSRKWGIPKGFIDRGDTPEEAALNEAVEEAGLTGTLIGDPIGTYDYEKWKGPLTVSVFVMEVQDEHDEWDEMAVRERSWHSPKEAEELLANHPISPLWDRIRESLATFR
jgi:8-oxo-dGTP pyrophosphatase MutT (NUDIX family)